MSYPFQELPDFCDAWFEMRMSVGHTKSLGHHRAIIDAILN
jgi:hypothetical protein